MIGNIACVMAGEGIHRFNDLRGGVHPGRRRAQVDCRCDRSPETNLGRSNLTPEELDPGRLMWAMHRHFALANVPRKRLVLSIEIIGAKRLPALVVHRYRRWRRRWAGDRRGARIQRIDA
jgi:hypothetical protein